MKVSFKYWIASVLLVASACNSPKEEKVKTYEVDTLKEDFRKVNKTLVENEEEEINNLVTRYGWIMKSTGSGLRYMIYKEGKGPGIKAGDKVKIDFETRLITGDLCYSSKVSGAKEMTVGKSGEVSGLEEGVMLLKVGDKAKLIIPSHLAFGLLGDEEKIPKRATLIYDIEILEKK